MSNLSATYNSFMIGVAREAGEIIKWGFGAGLGSETKDDGSPLTVIDTTINDLVAQRISERFPSYAFTGEEGGSDRVSPHRWICDPLEGTVPFLAGIPTAVFTLALTYHGESIAGVIYDPFMDRLILATKGEGTWLNGRLTRVRSTDNPKGQVVSLCWGSQSSDYLGRLDRLRTAGFKVLKMDSTGYSGLLVAAGLIVGDIYPARHSWDVAAQSIIVTEAGGCVTDLEGNNQHYDREINGCLISNGRLHDALLEAI